MSASAGFTSKQNDGNQQAQNAPAQDSAISPQNSRNSTLSSENSMLARGGYSSYGPDMDNGMGSTGYNSSYSSGYGNSYGGGYGSSYGSYGSGYSSYGGGYGASSYGGGYGSSLGGYGSGYGSGYGGYSSYGGGYNSNQYSNRMSKPVNQQNGQNPEEQGPQQVSVSQDVWGFLNGCQSILQILYAGTGIVQFGKMFVKMSMKIIKMVCGKSAGLVFKLTGFNFLKNIIHKVASRKDWSSEFSTADLSLESEWASTGSKNANRSLFGKIVLVTRLCSFLGALFAWFLKNKTQQKMLADQFKHYQAMTPEVPEIQLRDEVTINEEAPVQLEGVKSLYDDVKAIEVKAEAVEGDIEEEAENMVKAFEDQSEDMDADLRALETFAEEAGIAQATEEVKLEENANEEIKLVPEAEEDIEINNNHIEPEILVVNDQANEELVQLKEEIVANEGLKASEEVAQIKEIQEAGSPSFEPLEEPVIVSNEDINDHTLVKAEENSLLGKTSIDITENIVQAVEETTNNNAAMEAKIVIEDVWKQAEETTAASTVEEVKKEEPKKEEETKKFELPSVLQSLKERSGSSNKPWLMKKKKPEETKAESQSPSSVAVKAESEVKNVENEVKNVVNEVNVVSENVGEVKVSEMVMTPGNNELIPTTAELVNNVSPNATHITL